MQLKLRKALPEDEDWLWQLYLTTLKSYVEATWGWDEKVQRDGFRNKLGVENFQIVLDGDLKVAGFCAKEQQDCLWLHMLLVSPEYQSRGVGRFSMHHLQVLARTMNLPLRFTVMKVNPVAGFYEALGYTENRDDDNCIYFQSRPLMSIST